MVEHGEGTNETELTEKNVQNWYQTDAEEVFGYTKVDELEHDRDRDEEGEADKGLKEE